MHENEISYLIRGSVFKIHSQIGPGLLESAYEAALAYELTKSGLQVRTQVGLPSQYDITFVFLLLSFILINLPCSMPHAPCHMPHAPCPETKIIHIFVNAN